MIGPEAMPMSYIAALMKMLRDKGVITQQQYQHDIHIMANEIFNLQANNPQFVADIKNANPWMGKEINSLGFKCPKCLAEDIIIDKRYIYNIMKTGELYCGRCKMLIKLGPFN